MSTAKYDPIEAAKLGASRQPLVRSTKAPPAVVVKTDEPAPSKPATVAPVVSEAQKVAKRFRVKEGKLISWQGCLTNISAGSIVDASGYGPDGVEKLIQQGVVLEPLE